MNRWNIKEKTWATVGIPVRKVLLIEEDTFKERVRFPEIINSFLGASGGIRPVMVGWETDGGENWMIVKETISEIKEILKNAQRD